MSSTMPDWMLDFPYAAIGNTEMEVPETESLVPMDDGSHANSQRPPLFEELVDLTLFATTYTPGIEYPWVDPMPSNMVQPTTDSNIPAYSPSLPVQLPDLGFDGANQTDMFPTEPVFDFCQILGTGPGLEYLMPPTTGAETRTGNNPAPSLTSSDSSLFGDHNMLDQLLTTPNTWDFDFDSPQTIYTTPMESIIETPLPSPTPATAARRRHNATEHDCPVCNASFDTKNLLRKHQRSHTKPETCPVCSLKKPHLRDLHRHIWAEHEKYAEIHDIPNEIRPCPVVGCGTTQRKDNLARHCRTSHGVKLRWRKGVACLEGGTEGGRRKK